MDFPFVPTPRPPAAKPTQDQRPVLGLTIGDAAGIGPELIHEALNSGLLPLETRYRVIGDASGITPGQAGPESARRGLDALEEAVGLLKAGEIAGLVTGPVCKAAIYDLGFDFPGQTEFFARRFEVEDFTMCLTGPHLTVGLATIHIPFREIPKVLSTERIVRVGRLLFAFCRQCGHSYPRIAVAGLNPHAGESGRLGDEEDRIIRPAVEQLNAEFPGVFTGPSAPDTLFYHVYRRDYHAVVCMYHDQGLIPLKMVDFREGVNVTLGLPFTRTSPDHGTAFDLAGRGIARPDSFIAAVRLAAHLVGQATGERPL
jgi:4-hydroxythreonine-4-phosphate dehydrogenase